MRTEGLQYSFNQVWKGTPIEYVRDNVRLLVGLDRYLSNKTQFNPMEI